MESTSKPQSAQMPAVLTHAHILRCDLNYKAAVQRYNVTCEIARTPGKGATSQERSEPELLFACVRVRKHEGNIDVKDKVSIYAKYQFSSVVQPLV